MTWTSKISDSFSVRKGCCDSDNVSIRVEEQNVLRRKKYTRRPVNERPNIWNKELFRLLVLYVLEPERRKVLPASSYKKEDPELDGEKSERQADTNLKFL